MKYKNKESVQSLPVGVGMGVLGSVLTTLLGIGALAWLLDGEIIHERSIGYGTVVVLLLSSVMGTVFAITKIKERNLVVGLLVSAGYTLVLLACTALFFGGRYQGVGVTMLVILSGSVGAALMGAKMGKTGAITRHKKRNR